MFTLSFYLPIRGLFLVTYEWGGWSPVLVTKSNSHIELIKQKTRPCLGSDGTVGSDTQCEGGYSDSKEVVRTYFKHSNYMVWEGKTLSESLHLSVTLNLIRQYVV